MTGPDTGLPEYGTDGLSGKKMGTGTLATATGRDRRLHNTELGKLRTEIFGLHRLTPSPTRPGAADALATTIANGTGCAISLLCRTVPRAKISPHSSPSMRSGFRERTHEAQRRRSNPLDSRATHPRHEHDDARAAAAAAAVATSMGGSSHAADIATGDSAIGPRHGPPTPRRCWDLPRQ